MLFPSFSSSSLGSCLSFSHSWRFGELTALSLNNISPLWIINRVRVCVCALCICIEGPSMVCKTKQQQQQKQRWITASLLGSAKNPSKSRAKMLENKAKRGKKTQTHYTSNKRNKRKKSTLECGQFYLYCLPLCLITCSSLVVVFPPSLSHISHTFVHCIRNLLHPHERRASERMKKKSRTVCIFIHEKNLNIWIFMRTCFDSGCRSALAKPSCLSGSVLCIYSLSLSLSLLLLFPYQLQVLFTFEPFEWPSEVEKMTTKAKGRSVPSSDEVNFVC